MTFTRFTASGSRRRLALDISSYIAACAAVALGAGPLGAQSPAAAPGTLHDARELRLANVRQLTFGGENAEAYWAEDGKRLIFQSTRPPFACDQIFTLDVAPGVPGATEAPTPRLVSTGQGKTTCSYFYPEGDRLLYASTHAAGAACPKPPDRSQGYVWALDAEYEIYVSQGSAPGGAAPQGSAPGGAPPQGSAPAGAPPIALTANSAYDAEATICPVDGSIVFTSTRDGDLDLYRMDRDGGNVRRLTSTPGYDGGAFFSRDCKRLVWRASRPVGADLDDFRRLLGMNLVRPSKLEIWVGEIGEGGLTDARAITALGAASFAPYFYPGAERVIFSTNHGDPRGREFDLWAVDVDGTDLERISFTPGFDGFPMFSPDGKRLVFASNRNQGKPGETDVYLADWVTAAGAPAAAAEASAADRFHRDAAWFADDAREGRGIGTPGLDASAAEIERRFREIGLEPAGAGGTFRQEVDVTVGLVQGAGTALLLDGKAAADDLFRPLPFSSSKAVEGDVIFAGYGITAEEPQRDDYAGLDVKGKIVLVRRFVPAGFASDAERRYSDLRFKVFNARQHGAVGLLVADYPEAVEGQPLPDEATLPRLSAEDAGDAGIVAMAVKRGLAEGLVKGSHKARLAVELQTEKKKAANVLGRLRGGKPGTSTVILGAHYDHLGHGGSSSLAPGAEEIHNGADDNASGVAALLEAARDLAARRAELTGDVVFAAFAGEERGLLGSTAYTREPTAGVELAKVRAMINMDMVGRLRDNKLALLGGGSATEWPELAGGICGRRGIECAVSGDGYGPSDQTPFYAAGVPVIHLFTGTHDDYHKPSDDAARLNAIGGAQVAAIAADLAFTVANRESALTYASAPQPAPRGDARSFGASLGTIPDYTGPGEGVPGVLLAGVRPGGPAEKAGLARGDILVELAGREVRDINDMMFVLRSVHPGDKATAVVVRAGQRVTLDVVFGESRRM